MSSIKIYFGHSYQKKAKKFFKKHPDLFGRYAKILGFLEENPFHPSLRLHKLSGKIEGLHSVSLTMQYRITLELYIQDNQVILVNIGDHGDVY